MKPKFIKPRREFSISWVSVPPHPCKASVASITKGTEPATPARAILKVETPSGANKGDLLLPDATGRLGQNGSGGGNSEEILAISSSMLSEDAINPLRSLTATTQSPWR